MGIIGSLMVLIIMLIGLGVIVNGPTGGNWVFRTLVQNPSRAIIRAAGRGFRGFIRWLLFQIWRGIERFVRRYPRMAIIIVFLFLIAIEFYLLAY